MAVVKYYKKREEGESLHVLVMQRDLAGLREKLRDKPTPFPGIERLDEDGATALFLAVTLQEPAPEIVKTLLEAGANVHFVRIQGLPETLPELMEPTEWELESEMAEQFGEINRIIDSGPEHHTSLIGSALSQGSVEVIRPLQEYGADLSQVDKSGRSAIFQAIHGEGDRTPLIEYLIGLGTISLDSKTKFGETAILSAYRPPAQFSVVKALLDAGADPAPLQWTDLIRAVAIGTREEIEIELSRTTDIDAVDALDQSAIFIALQKGDLELAKRLTEKGASLARPTEECDPIFFAAMLGGNPESLWWLSEQGQAVDERDRMGHTALHSAIWANDAEMVRTLILLGADPNAKCEYGTILEDAKDPMILHILLAAGAHIEDLKHENRRALAGLGEATREPLESVTREQYLAGRYERDGRSNPERLNDPYKIAMIRAGVNAYQARTKFGDLDSFACSIGEKKDRPVWCATGLVSRSRSFPTVAS